MNVTYVKNMDYRVVSENLTEEAMFYHMFILDITGTTVHQIYDSFHV